MFKKSLLAALLSRFIWLGVNSQSLTVTTRTGVFVGDLNDTYPDVRQFKYVPYAKPPVGPRRWAPPERLDDSNEIIQSTVFGPQCVQYVSAVPNIYNQNVTSINIYDYGQSTTAGLVAQNSAEDCLTLGIWTPANASLGSNLPVIHFITGGGFLLGGVNLPVQLPARWVHLSQQHIVVTTNYRLDIFGYPNARGLNGSTNYGLLDQRLAIEWVWENIAAFGGDPNRITIWGQSAGAESVDAYLFAYYDDPLITGSVSSSGSVFALDPNPDTTGTNFSFVAQSLGCNFSDPDLELQCMRHMPASLIYNFLGQYEDNSTLINPSQPPILFTPRIDNQTIFANYTERYLAGKIANIPKIVGTCARDGSSLVYPIQNWTTGPNETEIIQVSLDYVCPAHNTSVLRNQLGLATYRYEFAGNFSNISPISWLGAYHGSDLFMLFASYLIEPGTISELEVNTSLAMGNYLLDFITDPASLSSKGWPEYNTGELGGGTVLQFGADGKVVQSVNGSSVEGACYIPGAIYNSTP